MKVQEQNTILYVSKYFRPGMRISREGNKTVTNFSPYFIKPLP